jgi:hypothetical protein
MQGEKRVENVFEKCFLKEKNMVGEVGVTASI